MNTKCLDTRVCPAPRLLWWPYVVHDSLTPDLARFCHSPLDFLVPDSAFSWTSLVPWPLGFWFLWMLLVSSFFGSWPSPLLDFACPNPTLMLQTSNMVTLRSGCPYPSTDNSTRWQVMYFCGRGSSVGIWQMWYLTSFCHHLAFL